MIASELQHMIWNAFDSAMIKIDLNKAFDRLSWPFLQGALSSLGFANSWSGWIMATRIKVNGAIVNWINGKSGWLPLITLALCPMHRSSL